MTSPRRRPGRPVELVELKITFRGDRATNGKIKDLVPGAMVRGGVCVVRIDGEQPAEVAEKARVVLERIRKVA